jgi:hypothetical protein
MIFETARTLHLRSIFPFYVISGETALIQSCAHGHLEITRFLVERGAKVEATCRYL